MSLPANSAFTYRGKEVDVRDVGRQLLGVRYALEGSVRKLGDTVRINAQLVSANDGAYLGSIDLIRDFVISRPDSGAVQRIASAR